MMARSSSLKRLDNSVVTVDTIVKYGLKRVTDWTRQELSELRSSKAPICVALTNGDFLVATYLVKKTAAGWQVNDLLFNDRRCAVFYCALTHLSKFNDADEMIEIDRKLYTLTFDKNLFRSRLDNAHLNRDQFRIDLFSSRFDESKAKLTQVKQDLEKTLLRAKYNNLLGTLT